MPAHPSPCALQGPSHADAGPMQPPPPRPAPAPAPPARPSQPAKASRQAGRPAAAAAAGGRAGSHAGASTSGARGDGLHTKRLAGQLKHIRLEDFMCHACLEMEFGCGPARACPAACLARPSSNASPCCRAHAQLLQLSSLCAPPPLPLTCRPHVTLVSGENGSGKSAVMQALQCCLGMRARSTGRATSLAQFIRTGAGEARIKVRGGAGRTQSAGAPGRPCAHAAAAAAPGAASLAAGSPSRSVLLCASIRRSRCGTRGLRALSMTGEPRATQPLAPPLRAHAAALLGCSAGLRCTFQPKHP